MVFLKTAPLIEGGNDNNKYAGFKIIQDYLVNIARTKLKNTCAERLTSGCTGMKVPQLLFDSFINMDNIMCRSCVRRGDATNIECFECNVASKGSTYSSNKFTYLIKSVDHALDQLGENIMYNHYPRCNTVSCMFPICSVDQGGGVNYRLRGFVLNRDKGVSTILFPIISQRETQDIQSEKVSADVRVSGLVQKLGGRVERVETYKTRLVSPIYLHHKKNERIDLRFEWATFNTLTGVAMPFTDRDYLNENEAI